MIGTYRAPIRGIMTPITPDTARAYAAARAALAPAKKTAPFVGVPCLAMVSK